LTINDAALSQDILIKHAKTLTKHEVWRDKLHHAIGDSILFMPTCETWAKQRKALSAAFFKHKLVKMTEIVKKAVRQEVTEWAKLDEIEIVAAAQSLQQRIIMDVALGSGVSRMLVDVEHNDGTVRQETLSFAMDKVQGWATSRRRQLFVFLFEELGKYMITPADRRQVRNVNSLKKVFLDMIDKRKKGLSKSNLASSEG
jgi:cytochrome P450